MIPKVRSVAYARSNRKALCKLTSNPRIAEFQLVGFCESRDQAPKAARKSSGVRQKPQFRKMGDEDDHDSLSLTGPGLGVAPNRAASQDDGDGDGDAYPQSKYNNPLHDFISGRDAGGAGATSSDAKAAVPPAATNADESNETGLPGAVTEFDEQELESFASAMDNQNKTQSDTKRELFATSTSSGAPLSSSRTYNVRPSSAGISSTPLSKEEESGVSFVSPGGTNEFGSAIAVLNGGKLPGGDFSQRQSESSTSENDRTTHNKPPLKLLTLSPPRPISAHGSPNSVNSSTSLRAPIHANPSAVLSFSPRSANKHDVPSADDVFDPPTFFKAQKAAWANKKNAEVTAAKSIAAAEANGNSNHVSTGALNLLRSLENIKTLQLGKPRRPAQRLGRDALPLRQSSAGASSPEEAASDADVLHPAPLRVAQTMNGMAAQVVRDSRGTAGTNGLGTGSGKKFPNRRLALAEDRKFRRPFIAPHFARSVDATQERLANEAHAAVHTARGDHADDFLKPSVPVFAMNPDRDAGMGEDPVGQDLFDRSLRIADKNIQQERQPDPRDRAEGGPRRGAKLRQTPHQLKFSHDGTTYESPADRRYRKTMENNRRRNASPTPSTLASSAHRLKGPPGREQASPHQASRQTQATNRYKEEPHDRPPQHARSSSHSTAETHNSKPGWVSDGDKLRDLEKLHKRTMELDRLAQKLQDDRARLEKERDEIFALQQSLLNESKPPSRVHGLERSVPTASDSMFALPESTTSYQRGFGSTWHDRHDAGEEPLDASNYMTAEELNDELARSSRHLNNEFEKSLRAMKRHVGSVGRAPLSRAAVETLDAASPRKARSTHRPPRVDSHTSAPPQQDGGSATPDAPRNELEDTLRIISEKRQRRIQQLQQLNRSATDFM